MRKDLSRGKAMAKAIQAAINTFAQSPPHIAEDYLSDGEGTQIILLANDAEEMRRAYIQARDRGIPCVFYEEAIGIGPTLEKHVKDIMEGFELYR